MAVAITWQQALAWRMQRHLLDPIGRLAVADVVDRLCGVQSQVASSAGLRSASGAEKAGTFLSLMAAGRSWERPSWQRCFGVTPKQLDALRHAVRVVLEGGRLTRDELGSIA